MFFFVLEWGVFGVMVILFFRFRMVLLSKVIVGSMRCLNMIILLGFRWKKLFFLKNFAVGFSVNLFVMMYL